MNTPFPRGIDLRTALLGLFLFLLPWQTRWIIEQGSLAGGPWEYGTVGIYATEVVLWFAFLMSIVHSIREKPRPTKNPYRDFLLAGALLVSFALLSLLAAGDRSVGFFAALHILEALLLIMLISISRELRYSKFLEKCFILGVAVQAALGTVQVVMQHVGASTILGIAAHSPSFLGTSVVATAAGRFLRAYGGLPHPNILGGYLAVALLLLFPFIVRETRTGRRTLLLSVEIVLAVGLFLTFSRSAWLGLILGFGLMAWNHFSSGRRQNGYIGRGFRDALLVLGLVTIVFGGLFREVLPGRIRGGTRLEAISQAERVTGISEAWTLIREHPWVGVGIGNYTHTLAELFPGRPAWSYQPVHNVPLLIFAELGSIGVLLVVLLIFFFIKNSISLSLNLSISLLITIATISLLDHYPWSLYSGLMLGALALGFSPPRTIFGKIEPFFEPRP